MRIGILETGNVNEHLVIEHGRYGDMFAALLAQSDPGFETFYVHVVGGEMPQDPTEADGWMITGSRHGAYDDLPWIDPLKAFLRSCLDRKVPVVGICFGHQILAEAMGGRVVKSDKGWGLGVHRYLPVAQPGWASAVNEGWSGYAIHQDQVIETPEGAHLLARSEFCETAALAYGPLEDPTAITVQSHPEFSRDFVQGLIDVRLRKIIDPAIVGVAEAELNTPVANADWSRIFAEFFRKKDQAKT